MRVMMAVNVKKVPKAIWCCKDNMCTQCPVQKDICDELWVDMETIPAELVDMIEDQLEKW